MNGSVTLASIAQELNNQPSLLESFRRSKIWSEPLESDEPILVGAGDSYAASLCASFLGGPRVLALDPYSLSESLGRARGRVVYILSMSGETNSNIELALSLKTVAKRVIAITCNPKSRLAGAVDRTVELPFKPVRKSPGFATFTLSLAAALRVCGLDADFDPHEAFRRASEESKQVLVATRSNVTHFSGNNEAYGISMYGTAKIYELLGGRAQASLLEEFSHMPLFSLSALDSVNVMESPGRHKGERLCQMLRDNGYRSSLLRTDGGRLESLYFLSFAVQLAAVEAARTAGLEVPYFLEAKTKLKISDDMIY